MNNIKIRMSLKLIFDLILIYLTFIVSLMFIYDVEWIKYYSGIIVVLISIYWIIAYKMNFHKRSWQYTSISNVYEIVVASTLSMMSYFLILFFTDKNYPIKIFILHTLLMILFSLGIRFIIRSLQTKNNKDAFEENKKRVLIIGAGDAGENIVRESLRNPSFKYKIIGLIDDSEKKKNLILHGKKVLGNRYDIPKIVQNFNIEEIIIAIPSAKSDVFQNIFKLCKQSEVEVKVVPSFNELLSGKMLASQLREIRVEDLLGRDTVEVNTNSINNLISEKVILITGGAGSIGSELSRQIAKHNPKLLINVDVNENALYFLELELKRIHSNINVISEICNIREREKLDFIFEKYKPNIVFHAAAHKHVPLMEHNPEEAVKNNIFGSKNVVDLADKYGVQKFVLISTDKAVNPTNIMGATKRATELIIQEKNRNSRTRYVAVRFGNVLGSNGSVIPIFKNLIKQGKNLTVTHPEITRYFMTIPEAAQLVLEAGFIGEGGEVFVLDMGRPVKIIDLAKNLIELSGLTLGVDINIDITGLRPGEKLFEELLYDTGSAIKTDNKKIFIAKLQKENIDVNYYLNKLSRNIQYNKYEEIKGILLEFITTYKEPEHHKK